MEEDQTANLIEEKIVKRLADYFVKFSHTINKLFIIKLSTITIHEAKNTIEQ